MIVAFSGRKFSGKDTAAEALINRHKFVRIGIADKLKDICAKVFEIHRPNMDDPSIKELPFNHPIRITPSHIHDVFEHLEDSGFVITEDAWRSACNEVVNRKLISIRDCLQVIGTDLCRRYVDDNIWLKYISKTVTDSKKNFVITDARFRNERQFFKELGAVLVLVKRKSLKNTPTDSHISENELGSEDEYDVIINNDACKNQLQSSISMWYILRSNGTSSNY